MRFTRLCPLSLILGFASCAADPAEPPDGAPQTKPCTAEEEQACFHGQLFVACPGETAPTLRCSEPWRCKWSSGCAPSSLPLARDCVADEDCLERGLGAGVLPWTRARAMTLRVTEGGNPPDAAAHRCRCDDPETCAQLSAAWLCDPPEFTSAWQPSVWPNAQDGLSWTLPGMVVVNFVPPADAPARTPSSRFAGLFAKLTLDLFREPAPRARLCVFAWSDGLALAEPACAETGEVHLSEVSTEGGTPVVHGTYRATFSRLAVAHHRLEGAVVLEGAF